MAARKKKAKRRAKAADRKFEVKAEVANFTLAKAPQAALSLFRLRTGRHVRVAALAGCDRTFSALAKSSPLASAEAADLQSEGEVRGAGDRAWVSALVERPQPDRAPDSLGEVRASDG